ncbi:hypothetical protein GKQ23_21340 [Erwinia sp. E602]|uniref:hypothetical protein n=1 Tax=Erwinia sp. E602 TaxID=2675378 RepID=UPI001BAC567D|nr:hypothetical protein [Erwinia sp. E602]QUG77382.1 hypothetical protein GKQ23_21340 [Erwinia sp. E602]
METEFTAGDFKRELSGMSDDAVISFAGGMTFYRFKRDGDNEFVLEFGECLADVSEEFCEENSHVLAVFSRPGTLASL